jgi:hypothetical protein
MSELFDRFEINRTPRWPLMSRLVALSVVVHGLFLVAVVYVPQLRNLLAVASAMSGIKFVSEDYDRTLIGQRATVIKLDPHEPLYYPPDYFGAPEVAETAQLDPQVIEQAAPPPPPPPVYRPRRPRVTTPRPEPTPTPEVAEATPTPTPVSDAERDKAKEELSELEKKTGVSRPVINRKPWEDLLAEGKQLSDQGKLNLNSAVEVSATGQLDAGGKIKRDSVKMVWKKPGDETAEMLAQKVITAVSESNMLSTLQGAKGVDMSLKLDEHEVAIVIANEFASPEEAKKYAEAYGLMLFAARIAEGNSDEAELYNNIKLKPEGNRFVITFQMSKEVAGRVLGNIINKKAAKDAAAAQSKGGA